MFVFVSDGVIMRFKKGKEQKNISKNECTWEEGLHHEKARKGCES